MRPPLRSSRFLIIVILSLAILANTIKISTTTTNAQSHLSKSDPTTLTELKKSVKVSNFPQLNGKPFIPFYSKSQISLLQNQINKELGNGQFSLNDYLSNKNKFNPQIAEEISEEVRNQFLQQIHEEAESAVLSCENPTNQFLATVCLMCKAEKAYLLTSESWFPVGLDNNYKDEFAKILNYAQYYIPNVRWIAAFGENSICLGSVDPTENLDIYNLLDSVTSRNTSYYIKPDFIQKIDQSQVNFAAFEYIPLGDNHSFIIDLIINFQQENQLQLSPSAILNFESIWIRSQEETSFASGSLAISSSITSIPFTLDLSTLKEYYLAEGDFSSQFIPLSSVYQNFNDDKEQLLQTISLPGVSNIEAFITSKIFLRFELRTRKIVQVNVELEKSPNFAITPEFYFIDPKFQIIINFNEDVDETTTTLKVEAIAQDVTEQITLQGVLTKSQSKLQQEIVLSQLHNPPVQLSVLENTFQTKDPSFQGFFPSNQVFENIHHHENLQNLVINIRPDSTPAYHISSDLSPNNGKFESILVIISGHVNSKTTITFSQKSLTEFLSASTDLSDDYIEPQNFTIIHCDHDLDSELFPQISSFQQGNPYWSKGTTFTYLVSIQDCYTTAFCNVFKNFVSDPTSNIIRLQGTLNDQNQKIELVSSSNIQSEDIKIGDLIFRDIHLNIDISPTTAAADSNVHLSFTNELPVFPNDQKLIFDGKIVFSETSATFYAKSLDTWSPALDLDFLQIGGLEIKGSIPSDSSLIQDMKATGILIWGSQCSVSSSGFNRERCIYGKSDILLNIQNISKSHAVGAYRGITGSNLLNSLLYSETNEGYDENIPKQFTEHYKLLGFAQLKYVPLSIDSTILLESQSIEAGIFVKGHSEFLGIQGETELELNPWRKNLEGSFVFGPTDIANGNILLKNMPNKMQLMILKDNQPGIIQMEGLMKILNFDGKGYWTLSNEETVLTTSISTQLFETINIKGLLTDIKDLKTAAINIQGVASVDQMSQLNLKLQQFFGEWIRVISAQLAKTENRLEYFKSLKEERQERLCKEESCELVSQCQDEPIKTCLQFDSINVCNSSTKVCTESTMKCTQKASFNRLCYEFEHHCSADFQGVCQEYETQIDESVCKTSGWTCQESLVPNPACKSECDRKQNEYEDIKRFYETLEDNHDRFNIKTETLKQFLADYALNPSVQVTNAEFAILLDSYKTSQDLNWQIEYKISNEDLDIMVEGVDLLDFNEGVAHIAKAIGVQTAQRYNFKWMDIQEMITFLTQEIKDGIPSSIQFIKLA